MPIPILEACKKRKRRPKVYNFYSFGDQGCPLTLNGPFRDNIRLFLQQCGEREDYLVQGMPIWCTLLVIDKTNLLLPFYTIEETVSCSPQPFCNHCRCSGWSGNFVSKRKYHMIIPTDNEWNKRLANGVLDVHTHLLHGLIHCNGFGHLLCINGIEGGSKYLCGREIMDLWDRICATLHARKITVEDVSKKKGMDLRLLYGVAYGHPWFGRWGYRFFRGSFGVKNHHYRKAVEALSSLQLDKIIQDFSDANQCKEMNQLICHYRDLSQTELITFRDILRFMLNIKYCPCAQNRQLTASTSKSSNKIAPQRKPSVKDKCMKSRTLSSLVGSMDSRWPKRRLEYAAEVIVEALRGKRAYKSSHGGMTRQDVRDAARMHIGDTGLLDYVLKSLNNVIVGAQVVRRAVNPRTGIFEYSIHEIDQGPVPTRLTEPESERVSETSSLSLLPGRDVYNDVAYLYLNVLFNYPESELVKLAAQAILDGKHLMKEWPFRDEDDQLLRFICRVAVDSVGLDDEVYGEFPAGELVILPLHATLSDLKQAAEIAVQDTYCILEEFVVSEVKGLEELEDGELLFGAIESGAELTVSGHGMALTSQLRYEGGSDKWKVKCECGAQDDDGERMVACDICEVWQHTRCSGIKDGQAVPLLFVCARCCNSLVHSRNEAAYLDFQDSDDLIPRTGYITELFC